MDMQFYGANCISLGTKQVRLVIDDNLAELGGKSITRDGDVVLFTGSHSEAVKQPKLVIDMPGEYEVQGIFIYGIQARAHMDEADKTTATMYKVMNEELSVLITGHIYPDVSDDQLEAIGMIDVMFVPVGGHGYTLDPTGASQLIKRVEPKIVIPTHYADNGLNYPVPQGDLQEALKGLAIDPKETVSKLKVKPADLTDVTQLIVLERA